MPQKKYIGRYCSFSVSKDTKYIFVKLYFEGFNLKKKRKKEKDHKTSVLFVLFKIDY